MRTWSKLSYRQCAGTHVNLGAYNSVGEGILSYRRDIYGQPVTTETSSGECPDLGDGQEALYRFHNAGPFQEKGWTRNTTKRSKSRVEQESK